tara:strand:- start:10925 stop:12556 length:1632 start_codon:yes stop_codon:yes gene_type:complete
MNSKFICIFIFLSIGNLVISQGLSAADKNFDNDEFNIAKTLYQENLAKGKMTSEQAEKLAYCYYITGDYNGIVFIDSLIKKDEKVDFLWLWKASLEKDKGEYESAIKSFENFQNLNNTVDVTIQIESCKMIPKWIEIPRSAVKPLPINDRYANSTKFSGNQQIFFFENGVDSIGKPTGRASLSPKFSEVVMMKPYVMVDSSWVEIKIPGMENYVINSLIKVPNSTEVIFDGMDILSENYTTKIFSGQLSSSFVVTNVKLIDGINQKELISNGQPTITSDGNTIVFTGISLKNSNLYRAVKQNGVFGSVALLQALNTEGNECYPVIIGDSLLTFSSDGKVGYGGLDIYSVRLSEITNPTEIKHLMSPINSTMDDFNLTWTSSLTAEFVSNRPNGFGDDDIWGLIITPEDIIPPVPDDGFEKWLETWQSYKFYFGLDSSVTIINSGLIDGLNIYSEKYDLNLKLIGQTDSQGSEKYNLALGMRRANYVQNHINTQLIFKSDIETFSIGENGIVNSCTNGIKCSDEEHQKNRFVELQIIPKKLLND